MIYLLQLVIFHIFESSTEDNHLIQNCQKVKWQSGGNMVEKWWYGGTKWKVVGFSTIAWVRNGDQPATSSNGLFCLPQNCSELVNGVCEVLEFPRNIHHLKQWIM
jgi:hypothetical protein